MKLEFPVKYFEENIIYNNEGETWAYYSIRPFNYEFLSTEEMMRIFTRQKALFWQLNMEGHLLIVNEKQSVVEMGEKFKRSIDGQLIEEAKKHTDDTTEALLQLYGDNSYKYMFYIGVKLKKRSDSFGLAGYIKKGLSEFLNSFNEKTGMDVLRIDEADYETYQRVSKSAQQKIGNRLIVDPLETEETQKLIERNFRLGMPEMTDKQPLQPVLRKNEKVLSTDGKDVLRLSECYINNENSNYLELRNAGYVSNVAYLTVASFPYEDYAIGSEFFYHAQSFDFPVDISSRFSVIGNKKATKMAIDKKKEIADQKEHIENTGNSAGINIYDADVQSQQLEAELTTSNMPLLKTSMTFCVYGDTKEELDRRVDMLKDGYADMQMQLEQPSNDQFLLFNEFIPGGDRYLDDYYHYMEPAKLASGMIGATQKIGDVDGFFIGTQGLNNDYVYLNVKKAAQTVKGKKTSSLSASFTGSTGGGKSFNANMIAYYAVLGGAQALIFDPKDERTDWKEKLVDIQDNINIITLNSSEVDKGKLDPWQVSLVDPVSLAISVVAKLLGVSSDDRKEFPIITKAVERVDRQVKPCLSKVVDALIQTGNDLAIELGEHLQSFASLSFGKLLFGDGKTNQIDFKKQLNILQVRGLKLPKKGKKSDKKDKLIEELSLAMMAPISVLSKNFLYSDRSVFKIFLGDEAWAFMQTDEGAQLFDELIREGRMMNAGLFIVTQNVDDLEGFENNIGMKFAFRTSSDEESAKVLKYYGLKDTKENLETLQNLEDGECLFKDIYGNVGVLQFRCLFRDLYDAFDTQPPETKKEVA